MINKNADEFLSCAVDAELENIKKLHGNKYNSTHEGYAVLLEEVEEAESELERIKEEMSDLWQNVKQNDNAAVTDALRRISTYAYFMLQETTQIVAVANKFRGV